MVELNDNDMTDEILREVTMLENIEETTGEWVLDLGSQRRGTKGTKKCIKQHQGI